METLESENVSLVLSSKKFIMDTRTRIIQGASALFLQHGLRSVTMDDVARELGMSKKTVYQFFSSKAEIIDEMVALHFKIEIEQTDAILAAAKDPVDAMVQILSTIAKSFRETPPHAVYDLRKYYPKSWKRFEDYKSGYVRKVVLENLKKGVAAGLYRKEIDLEIMAKLRVEQIDMVTDPSLFPPQKYDLAKLHIEQYTLFIHGIVTMKGKQLIYKYLNQTEDE